MKAKRDPCASASGQRATAAWRAAAHRRWGTRLGRMSSKRQRALWRTRRRGPAVVEASKGKACAWLCYVSTQRSDRCPTNAPTHNHTDAPPRACRPRRAAPPPGRGRPAPHTAPGSPPSAPRSSAGARGRAGAGGAWPAGGAPLEGRSSWARGRRRLFWVLGVLEWVGVNPLVSTGPPFLNYKK